MQKKVQIIIIALLYVFPMWAQNTPEVTAVFYGGEKKSVNDCCFQKFTKKNKCVLLCKYENCVVKTKIPVSCFDRVDSLQIKLVPSENRTKFRKCNIVKCYTNYRIGRAYIQTCLKCYESHKYSQLPTIILFSSRKE